MPLLYHNNNSISNITSFAQVPSGSPVLLSTATASGSSSISFTSGINTTYDVYYFEFINIHPSVDDASLQFNLSTDSGSNYNVTKTTTFFRTWHGEDDALTTLTYDDGRDLAQSTGYQIIGTGVGTDNDQNLSGSMQLFNPSSNTFVKHFLSNISILTSNDYNRNDFIAGYGNTTSPVNAIQFKFDSGNIDAGTIKMYGIK